jgi:alpha-mannosidase
VSLAIRLRQVRVLSRDLACWRVRSWVDTGPWSEGGRSVRSGEPWATERRLYTLICPEIAVPDGWPVDGCRLDLGGTGHGLVELRVDGRDPVLRPVNEHERATPLPARRCAARAVLAPVRDSDTGYVTVGSPWTARLCWLDSTVDECCRLLDTVCDAAEALGGHALAARLTALAEAAVGAISWPSATRDVTSRVAASEYLDRVWSPVVVDEEPAPLTDGQRASVAAATAALRAALAELSARYPSTADIALCATAHVDMAWLWPGAVSEPAVVGHFAGALDQLDRFPEYQFGQSGAMLYRTLERQAPDLFDRLRKQVAAGRWEPLGGMWLEPDVNLPSGESIVRQLLYGQSYFEDRFGRRSTVCWLPDTFGFPGTLPQLLAGAGLDYFFTTKMRFADTNEFPYDLFRWEGCDGTRVLVAMGNGPCGYRGRPDPATLHGTWRQYRHKHTHREVLLPIGHSSGIGPTDDDVRQAVDTQGVPGLPRPRFSSAERFFRDADDRTRHLPLPVWTGELYLEAHRGTYTSQGRTKVWHRRAEWGLVRAEAASAMAALRTGAEPADLTCLWQRTLDQQGHDIVTGASVAEVHELAERTLAGVAAAADRICADAVAGLASDLTGSATGPGILVVNPTLSVRPVRATLPAGLPTGSPLGQPTADGRLIAVADTVPPLSARWFPAATAPGVRADGTGLENDLVRVTVGDDGTLAGVWDKRLRRELLAGPGNRLVAYLDRPHFWDAWELSSGYPMYPLEPVEPLGVEVAETGPHRAAIRVRYRFRDSEVVQEIRLWANSARIDIATGIDWHERRVLLRAYFPTAVTAPFATCETAYGVVRRPTAVTSSWDAAKFEVPAHRFVDLSDGDGGLALLNNGRYGHRIAGGELSLSLLRSPVFPDPRADEGRHRFTYALFPHTGDWYTGGVLAEAEDLNAPLAATACPAASGTWAAVSHDGHPLALGALKRAERGDGLVLRAYEPTGRPGTARLSAAAGWRFAADLNLLEDRLGPARFEVGPHQVRTWSIVGG